MSGLPARARSLRAKRSSTTAGAASGAPRSRWQPPVSGLQAVALVGLVVGLLLYGLSVAAVQTCDGVNGTTSCGRAGYFVLFVVLVLAGYAGTLALRALRVPDPAGISTLGIGITSVIVLLVLVPALFSRWMIVVIPIVTVVAYLGAHWAATIGPDEGERPDDAPIVPLPASAESRRRSVPPT